jgi:cytochrome c553
MKAIIILVIGLLPGLAYSSELSTLASKLQDISQDKTSLNQALQRGKDRTVLCEYCHGTHGISRKPYIPNLAHQHPTYLLKQLLHFANGTRESAVMQPLAKDMTRQDMINIALYYSNMSDSKEDEKTQSYDPAFAQPGKSIFAQSCARCHGAHAEGNGVFPRLAGQKVQYVINTLKLFAAPESDKSNPLLFNAVRSNPEMVNLVRKMSPAQMRDVANYVASLR